MKFLNVDSLLLRSTENDLELRARWYIRTRWFFLLAIAFPGIVSNAIGEGYSSQVHRDLLLALAAILSNVLFYFVGHLKLSKKHYRNLAILMLAIDVSIITMLVYTKGGVESRSPVLYTIPILMASAIFGKRGVYYTALASILAYDGLIILDWANVVHSINAINPSLRFNTTHTLNTVTFISSVLLIIATLADFIVRLLEQKEKESRTAKEALEQAQEIAKIGSWKRDLQTNKVEWSKSLYTIYGVNQDFEPTYDSVMQFVSPNDKAKLRKELLRAQRTHTSFKSDYRIHRKDGSIRWIHSEGRVIIRNNEATHIVGTAQDITEQRELDYAKDEFLSIASHELRTPATAVKNFIGLLRDGYAGNLTKEQLEYINYAYESNERQLQIVDDLLHVARSDSRRIILRKRPHSLNALIESVVKDEQDIINQRKQHIKVDLHTQEIVANIDAFYLRMALSNLLSNASKYTPERGNITVSLRRRRDTIIIVVSDSGVGIAKRDLRKLFTKFTRINNHLSAVVGGSGLGLYLTKQLINLHDGNIEIKSIIGRETTFTVYLPSEVRNG